MRKIAQEWKKKKVEDCIPLKSSQPILREQPLSSAGYCCHAEIGAQCWRIPIFQKGLENLILCEIPYV